MCIIVLLIGFNKSTIDISWFEFLNIEYNKFLLGSIVAIFNVFLFNSNKFLSTGKLLFSFFPIT
jgi:hypothetical protein